MIADFTQHWLEDNINPELFENIERTLDTISSLEKFNEDTVELFSKMFEVRITSFEDQLEKLQTV